jgi:hypothetical protein
VPELELLAIVWRLIVWRGRTLSGGVWFASRDCAQESEMAMCGASLARPAVRVYRLLSRWRRRFNPTDLALRLPSVLRVERSGNVPYDRSFSPKAKPSSDDVARMAAASFGASRRSSAKTTEDSPRRQNNTRHGLSAAYARIVRGLTLVVAWQSSVAAQGQEKTQQRHSTVPPSQEITTPGIFKINIYSFYGNQSG